MDCRLSALHAQFIAATRSCSFTACFRGMRASVKALAPFPDPEALIVRLHGPGATWKEKDQLLRTLVTLAKRCGGEGDVATTLLMLGLWPGLEAAAGRLRS